jgi:hypothetical protein
MLKGVITLCYRKVIDIHAVKPWEKLVFADTYTEFLLQAQTLNRQGQYNTYGELLAHVPGADQLGFLVSAAAVSYLRQLNDVIPDITNNLGKQFLPFTRFRFEIINSDIRDKTRHQVGIQFYSEPLHWHDTIGDRLLVSVPGVMEEGAVLTELLALPPFVSIYSLQPAP